MPTYFIYCRKSSEAEDRQILSIQSQGTELKPFAAQKGIKVAEVLTEAKSAKAPGVRPVFTAVLAVRKVNTVSLACSAIPLTSPIGETLLTLLDSPHATALRIPV
jgi:hypothetical protein